MNYRLLSADDTERFYRMMCHLDEETEYMMFEPGERAEKNTDLDGLKRHIEKASKAGGFLLAAVDGEEIVGYIWAERGEFNRTRHTAYIVVGIRKAYRGKGIGSDFFKRLDGWANENGIVRLELTVECENFEAKKLYEKNGFVVEGVRPKSMKVNGRFVDEYYMGKVYS